MEYLFEALALVSLLSLSAFFSGSETAIFHLPRLTIEKMVSLHPPFSILRQREKLLASILFGNTLVNAGASIIAARLLYRFFHGPYAIPIITGIMTYIILIFGEFAPKIYSLGNSEKMSLKNLPWLRIFHYMLLPIAFPISALISFISKPAKNPITKEEMRILVESEAEEGLLTSMEKEFILKLLNFKTKQLINIMTLKSKIEALPASLKLGNHQILKLSHSRIPIYEGDLDHIVGILYVKDLFHQEKPVRVKKIIHKPYFVPPSMSASDLLYEFQTRKIHIAVVVDEKNTTKGIVTLDDILNTIISSK